MKNNVLLLSLVLALPVFSQAQIAKWTFETSVPATAGPFAPEVGSGAATGFHAGATVYSNPAGNGSAESYSSTLWAVGDYYQFQVSTVGYTGIGVSFDQTSSSTGPGGFDLAYSTDGSIFTTFASYGVLQNGLAPNAAWSAGVPVPAYSYSFDLSSVTAIDNAPAVYFRLVSNSLLTPTGGAVAAGGTDRVDNFAVFSPVPEPTGLFAIGGLGLLAWTILRRKS